MSKQIYEIVGKTAVKKKQKKPMINYVPIAVKKIT